MSLSQVAALPAPLEGPSRLRDLDSRADEPPNGRRLEELGELRPLATMFSRSVVRAASCGKYSSGGGDADDGVESDGEPGSGGEFMLVVDRRNDFTQSG